MKAYLYAHILSTRFFSFSSICGIVITVYIAIQVIVSNYKEDKFHAHVYFITDESSAKFVSTVEGPSVFGVTKLGDCLNYESNILLVTSTLYISICFNMSSVTISGMFWRIFVRKPYLFSKIQIYCLFSSHPSNKTLSTKPCIAAIKVVNIQANIVAMMLLNWQAMYSVDIKLVSKTIIIEKQNRVDNNDQIQQS